MTLSIRKRLKASPPSRQLSPRRASRWQWRLAPPAALHLYPDGADNAAKNIALPDIPVALAPLNDQSLAVATRTKLLLVNTETGKITGQADVVALDVSAADGGVAALTESSSNC